MLHARTHARARFVALITLIVAAGACGPGCPTTQPECDAPTSCGPDQVFVVGCNACVTTVPNGGPCDPTNPCFVPGAGVAGGTCAGTDSCQPSGTGFACVHGAGLAIPPGPTNCSAASASNACMGGLYCSSDGSGSCTAPFETEGYCALDVAQDGPCNINISTGTQCAPCAPGLSCVELTGSSGVYAPCTSDAPGGCTCRILCEASSMAPIAPATPRTLASHRTSSPTCSASAPSASAPASSATTSIPAARTVGTRRARARESRSPRGRARAARAACRPSPRARATSSAAGLAPRASTASASSATAISAAATATARTGTATRAP